MFLVGLFLLVVGYLYWKHHKAMHYWKDKGIRYAQPMPFVGNVYPLLAKKKTPGELLRDLYNQFPQERYFGIYQLTTPILVVRDVDLIKQILIKKFDHFTDHSTASKVECDPVWSRTLVGARGNKWRYVRSAFSPLFTGSKIRTMFVLIRECGEQLVGHLKDSPKDVIDLEMKDIAERYAMDVITTCALGIRSDSIKFPNNEILKAGKDLSLYTGIKKFKFLLYGHFPKLCMLLQLRVVSKRVTQFFRTLVLDTIKIRQKHTIARPDLIQLLMEARKGLLQNDDASQSKQSVSPYMSDEDVVAQVIVLILAGFDTSSNVTFAVCHELATHPQIQTRLRNEIRATLDKCNGQLTYEGLTQMKYMDMVVNEALRKWLQVSWLDRMCTKPFDIEPQRPWEKPFRIEKDQDVWIPVYAFHYDPKYFPNPDLFDPERFSDENKSKITPFTFMPFGEGPRYCIGNRLAVVSLKAFLFSVLSNFEIISNEKTMIPMKPSTNTFLLSIDGGCHLSLKRLA